ncbi:hypothetical protein D1007_14132 [Hordeum vulgare]|nr:hypothetical protein D1007_14132 [Hordeum vulgare]
MEEEAKAASAAGGDGDSSVYTYEDKSTENYLRGGYHDVRPGDNFKPQWSHVCMVFEFLGDNLLILIKYTDCRGIPLAMVKEICRHVLIGLDYLHRELFIIHTDLKPENIFLVSTIDP